MRSTSYDDGDTSDALTHGVRVTVRSEYLPEHTDVAQGKWFWAYHVTIQNEGTQTVQLMSRHWIFTNAHGSEEHVRGPGVVGEQPVLQPGQSFRYTSGCSLDTPLGSMHGTYQMVTRGGERFDAQIAPCALAQPYGIN